MSINRWGRDAHRSISTTRWNTWVHTTVVAPMKDIILARPDMGACTIRVQLNPCTHSTHGETRPEQANIMFTIFDEIQAPQFTILLDDKNVR